MKFADFPRSMNGLDICNFCSAGVWSELRQGSRTTLGSRTLE